MIPTQQEYLSPLYTAMNLAKGVAQRAQKGLVKPVIKNLVNRRTGCLKRFLKAQWKDEFGRTVI
jgi:hypothetical protein